MGCSNMKIVVEGTRQEITQAKEVLESVCLFNQSSCHANKKCEECKKEHNLIKEFIIKSE